MIMIQSSYVDSKGQISGFLRVQLMLKQCNVVMNAESPDVNMHGMMYCKRLTP